MEQTRHTDRQPSTFRRTGLRDDPPDTLRYGQRRFVGAVCLSVTGDLDLATISSFRTQVRSAAGPTDHLILDFSALRSIDPSGIHALLDACQVLTIAGRRMALVAVPSRIHRALAAFGVDEILPVFPTVEAAMAHLRDLSHTMLVGPLAD
jgi:anti-anti-sigma factor